MSPTHTLEKERVASPLTLLVCLLGGPTSTRRPLVHPPSHRFAQLPHGEDRHEERAHRDGEADVEHYPDDAVPTDDDQGRELAREHRYRLTYSLMRFAPSDVRQGPLKERAEGADDPSARRKERNSF